MRFTTSKAEWLILLFLAAIVTPSAGRFGAPSTGNLVNTSSGVITGHAATNRMDVIEYLGIPYAQPPIGDLRFAPPLPFFSSQPFDASSYVRFYDPAECCQTELPIG